MSQDEQRQIRAGLLLEQEDNARETKMIEAKLQKQIDLLQIALDAMQRMKTQTSLAREADIVSASLDAVSAEDIKQTVNDLSQSRQSRDRIRNALV